MKKQDIKPRKLKVYMIVILILLIPIIFFSIKAYGYNENIYWRGGSGNISDKSHWYFDNGINQCQCVPQATFDTINTVYFDANSGSGTVYLDTNISSGPIYLNNPDIKISLLNDTKWTIYSVYPNSFIPPFIPPFDALGAMVSAFYILAFVTGAVLFIMFAFWVRKIRGRIG